MLFSRCSATSAFTIALVVMAVTPYHRFSSSIGLASGAMTWLVILGACLAAFGHGVALRKGREIRRPGRLGVFGAFLAAIAVVPEWVDLAFYARGDSIPIVFAPIWLLHGVSCVSCFVGSLLLSYVIWGTADSPLTQRSTRTDERETRHPQDAIFTETIAVMSCLHESNEQRATRDPRDQADERNQGVGFIFNPTSKYDFELNVLHGYSVLRVSIGFFRDACRICQLVTSRTIQRDITMVSTNIQGCISIL